MGDQSRRSLRRRRAPTEQQQVGDQPPHAASSLPLESGTRFYGAAGWSPSRSQRAPRRSARQVELEYRRRLTNQRRAELEALRQDERDRPFLPAGGETGPMAGRSYRRLRLVPHRATSEVLAGAYPFLAEEGLGSEGMLIGQDAWSGAAFCYDPWELYRQGALTNPNICLAGQIGRGKSTLAKSLAARCIAFGRRVYVPGDPKGEWTVVTRALGGQVVELGVGTSARLNPLDDGPRPSGLDDAAWQAQVTARRLGLLAALAEATLGRALRATERTALDTALDAARCENSTPVLPMVVAAMLEPRRPFAGSTVEELRSDGREVAHALARLVRGDLAGLFDGPSTVQFDPGASMLSLDLSAVSGSDTLIGLVMTCASTWMEAALADPGEDNALSFTTRPGASWRSRFFSPGCRPSGSCRAPGDWRTSSFSTGCRTWKPWATSVRRPVVSHRGCSETLRLASCTTNRSRSPRPLGKCSASPRSRSPSSPFSPAAKGSGG